MWVHTHVSRYSQRWEVPDPQGAELLVVWSCQMWVLRTERGSSARVHTCNFLKILFLIVCIYAVVGCVHVSVEEGVRLPWSLKLQAVVSFNVGAEFRSSARMVDTLTGWVVSSDLEMTVPHHVCNSTRLSMALCSGWLWSLPLRQSGDSGQKPLPSTGFMGGEEIPAASLEPHTDHKFVSPFSGPPRRPHTQEEEEENTTH